MLRDPRALYEIADPRLFNLGRWPDSLSKKLSVCQQIAVSRICQASEYNPIVTVNGPPGTGKTTLLRDVLADVVVRRGYEIAGISDIRNEEIFEITLFRHNSRAGFKTELHQGLSDYCCFQHKQRD